MCPVAPEADGVGLAFGLCGLLCAAVSLGYFPPLFGAIAIGFGGAAISRRSYAIGGTCVVMGIVCAFIGSVLGAIKWAHIFSDMLGQ